MGLFSLLNVIPANASLVPQIGLVFFDGEQTDIPLGSMYPWKYIGLIGMMLLGVVVLGLYLKATARGFYWGRANRWSQYALVATAVTVTLTMLTMGYTRETARRAETPQGTPGWLINGCMTFDQQIVTEDCPAVFEPLP
jgi:cytochrome d ubiquinol oxidase subunit I